MSKRGSKSAGLPIIHARAAAIDVGARFHVAAVAPELCDEPVQTFQAFTSDIERMADWFVSLGIETVAMESTGVYWVPVYEVLEDRGLDVIVANARDARCGPCPAERATSTMRNGCSACTHVVCCEPASARGAISPRCAHICGCVSDTWTMPRLTSSTCKRR